jgi:hypothetical protein
VRTLCPSLRNAGSRCFQILLNTTDSGAHLPETYSSISLGFMQSGGVLSAPTAVRITLVHSKRPSKGASVTASSTLYLQGRMQQPYITKDLTCESLLQLDAR